MSVKSKSPLLNRDGYKKVWDELQSWDGIEQYKERRALMDALEYQFDELGVITNEMNDRFSEIMRIYPIKTAQDYLLLMAAERNYAIRAHLGMLGREAKQRTERGNDNKTTQKEKLQVKEEWKRWQKDPALYKNQTQFAAAMVVKYRHCTNTQTICRWCREWKSEILLAE